MIVHAWQTCGAPLAGGQTVRSQPRLTLKQSRPATRQQLHQKLRRNARPASFLGQKDARKGAQGPAVQCQAAGGGLVHAASSASPKEFKWGADMKNLGISVGLTLAVWFVPPPAGVTLPAWHLLAIFLGTIVGIITKPLPLGAVAMMGLGAAMLTKTLSFAAAFSAFASEIP